MAKVIKTDYPSVNTGFKVYVVFKGVEGIYSDFAAIHSRGWYYQAYVNAYEGLQAWFNHCRARHRHRVPPSTPEDPFTIAAWKEWRSRIDTRRSAQQFDLEQLSVEIDALQVNPARSRVAVEDVLLAAREGGGSYRISSVADIDDWQEIPLPPGPPSPQHPRSGRAPSSHAGTNSTSTKAKPFPQGRTGDTAMAGPSHSRARSSSPQKRGRRRVPSKNADDSDSYNSVSDGKQLWWYLVRGGGLMKSFVDGEVAEKEVRRLDRLGITSEMTMFKTRADMEAFSTASDSSAPRKVGNPGHFHGRRRELLLEFKEEYLVLKDNPHKSESFWKGVYSTYFEEFPYHLAERPDIPYVLAPDALKAADQAVRDEALKNGKKQLKTFFYNLRTKSASVTTNLWKELLTKGLKNTIPKPRREVDFRVYMRERREEINTEAKQRWSTLNEQERTATPEIVMRSKVGKEWFDKESDDVKQRVRETVERNHEERMLEYERQVSGNAGDVAADSEVDMQR
ncbi:hypothetical protein BD626DRAFT_538451 [Schizophyllum amplum]|uniref:Uncharacterized protein n=1 Tax=Schizophyllum amplum TaxID=97359 RepID=A0A550C7Y8_9AGAR|nr:hypothetical protein BD626DRAFT_538451 [Auriculariopsis ampla]